MKRVRQALLLAMLVLSPAAFGITVTDDEGRRLVLPRNPTRIISTAPGATEMLFAVGAGKQLIATVEYSDEPPAAKQIPRIGDGIAVDLERVVALRPDIVVVWPGGGNPAQIAQLEKLGLPLYRQQVNALDDIPGSLRRLGALTGTTEKAQSAAKDIETRLARLTQRYAGAKAPTVLLQVWDRPIYTIGGKHLMTDALRYCGARNVFADLKENGPAVDVEAVIARDPDFIIAVAPPGSGVAWLAEWKRFPRLSAVRNHRLISLVEGSLTRLGPSALDGTEALCRALDGKRSLPAGS
jgi:iron complex transport system substrate-binding protein